MHEFGGVYWMLDYLGAPVDAAKSASTGRRSPLYALAEYHAATGDADALAKALRRCTRPSRSCSHDAAHGGYFETYERDWTLAADQRLSAVDMDEKKSMNTHLHLMEAYATLLRSTKTRPSACGSANLIEIFLDHIIDPRRTTSFMFFDERVDAEIRSKSFGHDIEGSWLLLEAAEALGDHASDRACARSGPHGAGRLRRALDPDGGLLYEADGKRIIETEKHWWPQAEAVVGFFNAWQLKGGEHFLKAAERSWKFIDKYIVDHERGEWYWFVTRDGKPSDTKYKVDPWKCPYHNSRDDHSSDRVAPPLSLQLLGAIGWEHHPTSSPASTTPN
jgi:mannobiose 2-epimerase